MFKAFSFGFSYVLLLFVVCYGLYLFLSEQRFRRDLPTVPAAITTTTQPEATLSATSPEPLMAAMGFAPQGQRGPAIQTVKVHGIFMASGEVSRALLTLAGKAGTYRVDERLPDGSVLRRVEPNGVSLLRNGREAFLPMTPQLQPGLRTEGAFTRSPFTHLIPINVPSQGQP